VGFRNEAWTNRFNLSPQKWIENTGALGMSSKSWKNWWTYAHEDIAIHFWQWLSPEFSLYVVKEFKRFKQLESQRLSEDWKLNRVLSKVNYRIHTDSVKENLIDWKIENKFKQWLKYADEADMLNIAVFWKTNKSWREEVWISSKKKNIRDYANIHELIVLSNLEYLNSVLIEEWIKEEERFEKLCNESQKQLQNILKNQSVKNILK